MHLALLVATLALATTPVQVHVSPGNTGGANLKRLVESSAERALAHLPRQNQVRRIDVRPNPDEVIPEVGVGAYTDLQGNVHVSWDPTRVDVRKNLLAWIPLTVAHELNHSSRIR